MVCNLSKATLKYYTVYSCVSPLDYEFQVGAH